MINSENNTEIINFNFFFKENNKFFKVGDSSPYFLFFFVFLIKCN